MRPSDPDSTLCSSRRLQGRRCWLGCAPERGRLWGCCGRVFGFQQGDECPHEIFESYGRFPGVVLIHILAFDRLRDPNRRGLIHAAAPFVSLAFMIKTMLQRLSLAILFKAVDPHSLVKKENREPDQALVGIENAIGLLDVEGPDVWDSLNPPSIKVVLLEYEMNTLRLDDEVFNVPPKQILLPLGLRLRERLEFRKHSGVNRTEGRIVGKCSRD